MPLSNSQDTIAAISTAMGPGAIGIVRLSGPGSLGIARKIFRAYDGADIDHVPSHSLRLGTIVQNDNIIDEVLLAVMHAGASYTRQDMVEIHCHGGSASVRTVLDLVLRQGARMASPGEFTRLAFESGRIDLSQAQAVLDIIEAKTTSALRAAANRLSGRLGEHIGTIKELVVSTLSEIEASIDFPDEDLGDTQGRIVANLEKSLAMLQRLKEKGKTYRLYRDGLCVVIAGKPNVGKSSLFNMLLKESRAIVTPEPGTTRDLIEETLSIKGVPVKLIDSAGLRKASTEAERFGVELARDAMKQANLVLIVLDSSRELEPEDQELMEKINLYEIPSLHVLNKIDLPGKLDENKLPQSVVKTSATTGLGMDQLNQAIAHMLMEKNLSAPEDALVASARESDCINRAHEHVERAMDAIKSGMQLEAISVDLRDALSVLGQVLGDVDNEEILEEIFSRFCIGK